MDNEVIEHQLTQEEQDEAVNTTIDSLGSSFACADLNELWAAAIPLSSTEYEAAITEHQHAHEQQDVDQEQPQEDGGILQGSDDNDVVSKAPSTAPTTPATRASRTYAEHDLEQGSELVFGSQGNVHVVDDHDVEDDDDDDDNHSTGHKSVSSSSHQHLANAKASSSSRLRTVVRYIKYVYSGLLLAFCILMVSAAIFQKQTTATGESNVHPIFAFAVFWALILWLALMEGGLNCMVGLKPIPGGLYARTHPLARKCTAIAHKGDNLERFIVGRQFLDLSCVFLTNFMVSAIAGASVLGLPSGVTDAFLGAGLAVILVTIVIGQLVSQINAAHCMLDFINNWPMVITTYAALTLENSGLLHATYLIRIIVSKLAGKPIQSAESGDDQGEHGSGRTVWQRIWFWTRVVFSTSLLGFAFAVTIAALFENKTTMWESVPAPASIALFVALILLVGNMEGLQIAMFAVVHLPRDELDRHPVAKRNCEFTFRGSNLQAFLVGRQILQTIVMFMIARITTLDVDEDEENVFGVSDGLQNIFNTGVLGALISTIVASLSWRILASSFPIAFLGNPLARITIQFCLFVENTGVCAVSWLIAAAHKKLARLQVDEVYVGTAADRAAAKQDDDTEQEDHGLDKCTSSESSH